MLSPQERKHIESLEPYTLNDLQRIQAFAHRISQGKYIGSQRGKIGYTPSVHITCYRANERLTSFTAYGLSIISEDRSEFEYTDDVPVEILGRPPELRPFELRFQCASNMEILRGAGPLSYRKAKVYPTDGWSDAIVRALQEHYYTDDNAVRRRNFSDKKIAGWFTCPSVLAGVTKEDSSKHPEDPNLAGYTVIVHESHYAANSDCQPTSARDTVLLFETQAGWNQHGGPELFTFDHHEPRGGLVMLNDGTVKFIRTEEELKQLRWK